MENKEKYEVEKNYVSLIQMNLFHGIVYRDKMAELFEKATNDPDKDEYKYYWIKAFYQLYLREFEEAKRAVENLENALSKASAQKQEDWKKSIEIIRFEIALLERTDS